MWLLLPPHREPHRCHCTNPLVGLQVFRQPDAVMEPNIFDTLCQYVAAHGQPRTAIELLCENYVGEWRGDSSLPLFCCMGELFVWLLLVATSIPATIWAAHGGPSWKAQYLVRRFSALRSDIRCTGHMQLISHQLPAGMLAKECALLSLEQA